MVGTFVVSALSEVLKVYLNYHMVRVTRFELVWINSEGFLVLDLSAALS